MSDMSDTSDSGVVVVSVGSSGRNWVVKDAVAVILNVAEFCRMWCN